MNDNGFKFVAYFACLLIVFTFVLCCKILIKYSKAPVYNAPTVITSSSYIPPGGTTSSFPVSVPQLEEIEPFRDYPTAHPHFGSEFPRPTTPVLSVPSCPIEESPEIPQGRAASPPSYDDVMGNQNYTKPPSYNPNIR